MEASALASQVEKLAQSIASNPSNVQPEDRNRALKTLVELRRLDQLKAIASSSSNSTYFFGDKSALGLGNGSDAYNIDYAEKIKGGVHKKVDAAVSTNIV